MQVDGEHGDWLIPFVVDTCFQPDMLALAYNHQLEALQVLEEVVGQNLGYNLARRAGREQ